MAQTQRRTTKTAAGAADKPKITGIDPLALEREGGEKQPYRFPLAGKVLTIKDPLDEPWQNSVRVDPTNAVAILRALMSAADWEHFKKTPLKGWQLVGLVNHFREYYGWTEENEGNADALPTF